MPRVTFIPQRVTARTPEGATLFDAANWAGLTIDSTCGGRGTCGKCRVMVDGAEVLACRYAVTRDCTVEVPRPPGAPRIASLGCRGRFEILPNVRREGATVLCGEEAVAVGSGDGPLFGLALDIGTTSVAGALVNLEDGVVQPTASLLNQQAAFGADVIARISHAGREGGLRELQTAVVGTINELIGDLLAQTSATRDWIYEMVAVGNATMLHLLLGVDPSGIGVSPFVPVFRDARTVRAADLGLRLHSEARLTTLPLVGAYVGADIVAGLVATEFMRHDDARLRLYVDVGTNGEAVLRCGDRCLCAAAPAGPAFEGAHIRYGMRASAGAIEHVEITDKVRVEIVGGMARPAGICGSGLIDAVAEMRKVGAIDGSGRLAQNFALSAPEDGIVVTQGDIRAVQYAKAAIAAAIEVLLRRMDARAEDIEEVLLAGAFGSYLRPASARAIGLVPWVPLERIRAVGNAAGEGAIVALLSLRERQAARQMPKYIEYVELSVEPEFNRVFTDRLAFPAIEAAGAVVRQRA